jgi:hypothetical protein
MADDFEYVSHARLEYRKGFRHSRLPGVSSGQSPRRRS